MASIQTFDPARMTSAQRRTEAAALLAQGLHRLRGGDAHDGAESAPSPVGFGAAQRVHVDPDLRRIM